MTISETYRASALPIREDLAAAHTEAWAHLARPGTWWTGRERVAIAEQVRTAKDCALCRERKAALSPYAVPGSHEATDDLSAAAVDVVHRVVTDSGRLSKSWFNALAEQGLDDAHYVELVAVCTRVLSIDMFCHAMGLPELPLPEPVDGEPSRVRPPKAALEGAWVPMISVRRAPPNVKTIYGNAPVVPNAARALSLVPDEQAANGPLTAALYLPRKAMDNLAFRRGGLSRAQIEFVASKVSAYNECFY